MKLHEECGLFGICNNDRAAELTFLGLYALQHRGQEASGIVSTDGTRFYEHKGLGLVSDLFDKDILLKLEGLGSIGHNRYSTTGSNSSSNVQPLVAELKGKPVAVAHNGNLVNASVLTRKLIASGSIFHTSMDSEVILHLMAKSPQEDLKDMFIDALRQLEGAFSVILLTRDYILAAKDPLGFRPLCIGQTGESICVASETCALDIVGAKLVRELEPGEMALLNKGDVEIIRWTDRIENRRALCIFEHIYFSRPDSILEGRDVHSIRKAFGRELAVEHPVEADVVISVPDSGNAAALGYSEATGIPLDLGLIRNHYVGRTFIDPSKSVRHLRAALKYNPVRGVLHGKRVVVVDDSMVRGTTSRMLVKLLRQAGAREVHFRIASGPILFGCYYGIDTPEKKELVAAMNSIEKIKRFLEVDSLSFLSVDGMLRAVPGSKNDYCLACFNGNYPVEPPETLSKNILEKE